MSMLEESFMKPMQESVQALMRKVRWEQAEHVAQRLAVMPLSSYEISEQGTTAEAPRSFCWPAEYIRIFCTKKFGIHYITVCIDIDVSYDIKNVYFVYNKLDHGTDRSSCCKRPPAAFVSQPQDAIFWTKQRLTQ